MFRLFARFRRRERTTECTYLHTNTLEDRLPSHDASLCFTAQLQFTWRSYTTQVTRLGWVDATQHVRRILETALCKEDVLRPGAATENATRALLTQFPLRTEEVEILDTRVQVLVDEETEAAARCTEHHRQQQQRRTKYLQRELELDDIARQQARARTEFLRTEVLVNPATARLYGLMQHTNGHAARLGIPISDLDLADLAEQLQKWDPEFRWGRLAQIIHEFTTKLTTASADELLRIFAHAAAALGDSDIANQITVLREQSDNDSEQESPVG